MTPAPYTPDPRPTLTWLQLLAAIAATLTEANRLPTPRHDAPGRAAEKTQG